MIADEELIEQIRRGKREAYGHLFSKYYTRIYSLCLSMLRDPQLAEETAQDVFVHAYLKLDQLRNPGRFFPWLRKIAQTRARNSLKRLIRSQTILVPLDAANTRTDTVAPDEQLLRQELVDTIMAAIELLPEKDRRIVQARIDGLSHKEISERFGIFAQASLSRLYRARKKLAARVQDLVYGIFGLLRKFSIMRFASGGIMAMKAGTGIKMAIGIVGIIAAIFVGFQLLTRDTDVQPSLREEPQQAIKPVGRQDYSRKMDSRPSGSMRNVEDMEDLQDIEEFLAWLDSIEPSAAVKAQEDVDEVAEGQEISSELREKVELFNALMEIIPAYEEANRLLDEAMREIVDHNNSLDETRIDAEVGMTYHGPIIEGNPGITVLDKQNREIVGDPYLDGFLSELSEKVERAIPLVNRLREILDKIDELHPGAVEWIESSSILAAPGLIKIDVLRGYLGKELPYSFRGYSNYFDARDYKP